jgi:Cu2+-containing amine oxidase
MIVPLILLIFITLLSVCLQGFFFLKRGPLDNEYAHPLDLTVIVDLNEEKVREDSHLPASH